MEKYKCEKCGKKHTIYRSLEIPLPRMIIDMSEEEREKRVKDISGFQLVDDKLLFANGWINIEAKNNEFPFFYWKTWSSISKEKFQKNIEELKTGKLIEFEGNLENEIPFYINSKGLKSKTLIQASDEGLIVEIQIQEDSKLKEDQSKPISKNRIIEIMQMIHHNPKRMEKQNFDKSFSDRLLNELNSAEKEFIKEKKDFVINISSSTVLFQIISNQILETNRAKERGFGLHLSFDESFGESIEEIAKFRSKNYSKEFDYHNLDEIPTYQIDVGENKNRLQKLVEKLIIDVYEEDLEMIEIDNFEI